MVNKRVILFLIINILTIVSKSEAQALKVTDDYLILNAGAHDPLYTTYTAAIERSLLYSDKGYKMIYDDDYIPLTYGSEHGGRFFCIWEINNVVVNKTGDFYARPVVKASFPDMALLEYMPWPDLKVEELFFVYSSHIALVDCQVTNQSAQVLEVNMYPVFEGADSLYITGYQKDVNAYSLNHFETKKRLISNLGEKYPYPTLLSDLFYGNFPAYSWGGYQGDMKDFYNIIKTDFYSENRSDSLNMADSGYVDFVALHGKFMLHPGERMQVRFFRGYQPRNEDKDELSNLVQSLNNMPLQPFIDDNIRLFSQIPRIDFKTPAEKMIYLSAFNLVRGCMLPPAGQTKYNFYVFSREPLWGWGHGHQVLHESLSMLAYVYLDPVSAQNSQRVYMEQQGQDGLIAYRHGPRGAQTYPHEEEPTTSAPFYSWINWEVYQVSKDRTFLEDSYISGVKYMEWLKNHRDTDHDGTYEWGPYGIIENVRDWYNAVYQVSAERYLDVDKEDISDELECLDLSLMIVNEMRALSSMAEELGKKKEGKEWLDQAEGLSALINERMWDDQSKFFYSINKRDHRFFFMTRDLKRQEIIGFLPMWANAVAPDRAEELVLTLTDPGRFWRKYGVPTLSAEDVWYSPYVDYCCKWNGPVWLLWDYMVFRGLVNYGYDDLAIELSNKMISAVELQLTRNHNFWESYSPDNDVLNCPPNYIWDAIIARLMIDREKIGE
jgi:hypothetical protein